MKRMHIHVGVDEIERSIRFYSALFGADPVKVEQDYAKWMLEDPRVNFAISTRASVKGVDHLGLQVDDGEELDEVRARLESADLSLFDEGETVCCYARSDKSWVKDPDGIAWEAYRTMEDARVFSEGAANEACCGPEDKGEEGCCVPSAITAGCCP